VSICVVCLLVLLALCYGGGAARVEAAESCQQCRDYNRACLRNHSPQACRSEYEICMKHCREK